jgi:hypothetical protein
MDAVETGTSKIALRFRTIETMLPGRRNVLEAIVSPDEPLTLQVLWVVHMASDFLGDYFRRPPEGGGV